MNLGSNDLWLELSTMADEFADLGRRLLSASRLLHAPGILPLESLLEPLSGLQNRFDVLRRRVRDGARSLGVAGADADPLNDLKTLAVLLEQVEAAEERRAAWNLKVAKAVAVLDGVLDLRHAHLDEFQPLRACRERAKALRDEIKADRHEALAEVVQGLGDMDHPFAYVLTMARGAEGVDDDLWESLFEAVGVAFSRPFAAAVARGRIVSADPGTTTPDRRR